MSDSHKNWSWIPTLYIAEGFPYAVITALSLVMFKTLPHGMSDAAIIFWTSLLGLPWVLKPFWAPCIDLFGKKRNWILLCQVAMGAAFLATAAAVPFSSAAPCLILLFLFTAFASATHDAAADGFYIIALTPHEQAFFSGIRNTFYRLALLAAQGVLLSLVFTLTKRWSASAQWTAFFVMAGGILCILAAAHVLFLPHVETVSVQLSGIRETAVSFLESFQMFFRKKRIVRALLFLLFYRFAEAQLTKASALFLLETREQGGLALNTAQYANIYGTAGMLALLAGGILGGIFVARFGLGRMLLLMALAINLPDIVYVYLAFARPEQLSIIASCVGFEQFGYGFGFTAYTMFMLFFAEDSGKFRTTHYAFMTGIMALSLMLPGMVSGAILDNMQSILGPLAPLCERYELFFLWVMICTIPALLTVPLVKGFLPTDFGRTPEKKT